MSAQDEDAYSAAAQWHTRLEDEDRSAEAFAQFDAWLSADERHRAAFAAVERSWSGLVAARVDHRVMNLRREALAATRGPRVFRFAAAAAVAGATIALGYFTISHLQNARPSEQPLAAGSVEDGGAFRTAVGERSNVTLSDGSSVVLNTRSRIDVHFTAGRRSVRLLEGQAWFQVAKDASRPFVVEAADQRVTALGTAFDIRLGEQDSVQVTLAEGRVSVEPIRSSFSRLLRPTTLSSELAPGEALIVSADKPARKRKADLTKVAGWREGQIVFDDDTLEGAVAEVNRYSPTRIELADPSLAQLRVSGVFKAGHSESFVETVSGHFPIRITARDATHIVLAPDPK